MYRTELGTADKLFGTHALHGDQARVIKQTYLLLGLAVVAAMIGAHLGSTTPAIINFFSGIVGWIVAMIALNAIPMVAMALRHNGPLGMMALLLDGFVAGLILGPIVFLANSIAPGVVTTAMMVTGIIFAAVTGYVFTSKRQFSAPRGLMTGAFVGMIGVAALNMFLGIPLLSLLLSAAIGIFGLFILIFSTSEILNNPEADSPIPGALMLFAGLFQIFQAIVHILLAFTGGDD